MLASGETVYGYVVKERFHILPSYVKKSEYRCGIPQYPVIATISGYHHLDQNGTLHVRDYDEESNIVLDTFRCKLEGLKIRAVAQDDIWCRDVLIITTSEFIKFDSEKSTMTPLICSCRIEPRNVLQARGDYLLLNDGAVYHWSIIGRSLNLHPVTFDKTPVHLEGRRVILEDGSIYTMDDETKYNRDSTKPKTVITTYRFN